MKYDLSPLITLSIFSALMLLVGFGAFSFAVAAVTLAMWLYFVFTARAFKHLKVNARVYPSRVFTDDPVKCETDVRNCSRFTFSHVELIDFGAEGYTVESTKISFEEEFGEGNESFGRRQAKGILKPKDELKVKYAMGFRTRGEHEFHNIRLLVKSALGVFAIEKTFSPEREVLVFPKILPIDKFKTMLVDPTEGEKSDFKLLEDSSHIVGVHEYSQEPFQRIHWKISAHLDKLMVKEYEYTASSIIRMYVDYNLPREVYARNVWSSIRKDYEEYSSIASSGIIKYFADRGMEITLKVLADKIYEVSPQMVRKDYVPYLDVLARSRGIDDPSDEVSLEKVLERDIYSMSRNTTVVLISLYLTDDVVPKLLTIRSRVSSVIAFVMPYGFRMPYHKKYRTFAILPQEVKKLRDQSTLLMKNNVMVHVMMDNESVDEVIRGYEQNPLENR